MKMILASTSPTRKKLFKTICPEFEIINSNFDESKINCSSPQKLVKLLAEGKCNAVFSITQGERCVIGADSVVCIDNNIYGKPKDEDDARRMIKSYSENTCKFITGVCINYQNQDGMETKIVFSLVTKVKFRKIHDDEIEYLINSGEGKFVAGACTIEGIGGKFMEKVIGSYHNILGLPTSQLYEILRKENIV